MVQTAEETQGRLMLFYDVSSFYIFSYIFNYVWFFFSAIKIILISDWMIDEELYSERKYNVFCVACLQLEKDNDERGNDTSRCTHLYYI